LKFEFYLYIFDIAFEKKHCHSVSPAALEKFVLKKNFSFACPAAGCFRMTPN
jgi:hypothetical protein